MNTLIHCEKSEVWLEPGFPALTAKYIANKAKKAVHQYKQPFCASPTRSCQSKLYIMSSEEGKKTALQIALANFKSIHETGLITAPQKDKRTSFLYHMSKLCRECIILVNAFLLCQGKKIPEEERLIISGLLLSRLLTYSNTYTLKPTLGWLSPYFELAIVVQVAFQCLTILFLWLSDRQTFNDP